MDSTQRLGYDQSPDRVGEAAQHLLSRIFPEHFQGVIPFATFKKVE